ncbi:MAG: hypothetical protein ACI95T_001419 [Flavobacteriales bacterium]
MSFKYHFYSSFFYFFFFKKRPSNQLETYFSKTKTKIKGFPLGI